MADATMKAGDNPADYTVAQVNDYLATADDAEKARVLEAERTSAAPRKGITGVDTPQDAQEPAQGDNSAQEAPSTTTRATTFQEAAKDATPAALEDSYHGHSPERERTGKADKGLTVASVLDGPAPDPRPGIDTGRADQED